MIHDWASEIWRTGGALRGGTITLNVLSGQASELYETREAADRFTRSNGRNSIGDARLLVLRLDDNDEVGHETHLLLRTEQRLDDPLVVTTLAPLGAIIVIKVAVISDKIEEGLVPRPSTHRGRSFDATFIRHGDGSATDLRLVRGTIIDAAPCGPGAQTWPAGAQHSEELGALVCQTTDAAGKLVAAHVLCLEGNPPVKTSAAEKRRRMVARGLPPSFGGVRPAGAQQQQCQRCGKINGVLPAVEHQLCVECGWCIVHNTEHSDPAKKETKFAPLAAATLNALSSPAAVGFYSETVGKMFIDLGVTRNWNRKTRERLFDPGFTRMQTQLRRAPKFVFDADFSRLVVEASEQDPLYLMRLMQTARPPFDTCWIEWQRQDPLTEGILGSNDTGTAMSSFGVLINRRTDITDNDQYVVVVATPPTSTAHWAMIWPIVLLLDFRGEALNDGKYPGPSHLTMTSCELALSPAYCNKWGIGGDPGGWPLKYRQAANDLLTHGKHGLTTGPYGRAYYNLAVAAHAAGHQAAIRQLGSFAVMAHFPFRELIAGLALVATHIGGDPLVKSTTVTAPRTYYRGRFHPALEYRVLELARPMSAPHLFRATSRAPIGPKRQHAVSGHWRHERAANAICATHPYVCPRANWLPVEAKGHHKHAAEPEEKHGDLQGCTLCHRRRHFVRDHFRGDVEAGTVVKDYKITANKRRRKPPDGDVHA